MASRTSWSLELDLAMIVGLRRLDHMARLQKGAPSTGAVSAKTRQTEAAGRYGLGSCTVSGAAASGGVNRYQQSAHKRGEDTRESAHGS
jgi:hypothetical protein